MYTDLPPVFNMDINGQLAVLTWVKVDIAFGHTTMV